MCGQEPQHQHGDASTEKLGDTGYGNDFLKVTLKAEVTHTGLLSKLKTAKDTINNVKKQPREWEKISANHVSNEGFVSKNIENSEKSTTKKSTQLKNG